MCFIYVIVIAVYMLCNYNIFEGVCMYVCECMCICICVYVVYMCVYVCVYVYVCMYVYECVYIGVYVYVCVCRCACVLTSSRVDFSISSKGSRASTCSTLACANKITRGKIQ